ncbi:MAG: acyl carrier protein [Clostridiaceae bacterium]|jgi:acyl carrier protein|nr:acyl carrier protein [Bacillota bacterium]NLN52160.1 acyl carrier protein [Clostridiaceae bacterium]
MSAEDIFEQVKELLVDQLGVDEEAITMDSDFIDDLNADSLDIVDLIITLETEYDISIPDEDAQRLKTVGDAVDFIVENAD